VSKEVQKARQAVQDLQQSIERLDGVLIERAVMAPEENPLEQLARWRVRVAWTANVQLQAKRIKTSSP
jgi:hypothetical protein